MKLKVPAAPPLTRTIQVHSLGVWFRVHWNYRKARFDVQGDDTWFHLHEIDDWREAPHPSIGIGTPRE